MKRSLWIALLFFVPAQTLRAASYDWPFELVRPEDTEVEDSSGYQAATSQDLYEKIWRSKNQGVIRKNTGSTFYRQSLSHELTYDHSTVLNTRYNTIDLAGAVYGGHIPSRIGRLGLEWHPFAKVNQVHTDTAGSRVQADLDLGPSFLSTVWGTPVEVKGGFAARTSSEALREDFRGSGFKDFSWRSGMFGSFEAGDFYRPLEHVPLHVTAKLTARTLGEQTRFIGSEATVLGYRGLESGDSLFAHFSDTIVHGDNAKAFRDEPSITEHGLGFTTGLKGVARVHVAPAIVYSFHRHSKTYPWNPEIIRDVRRTDNHRLQFMGSIDSTLPFEYEAGIQLDWKKEDWLFDRVPRTSADSITNRNDFNGFRIETNHHALINLPLGMSLGYTFSIYRYSKYFRSKGTYQDASSNFSEDDHDEIVHRHDGKLMLLSFPRCSLDVFGGYRSYLSHYLHRSRSGSNMLNRSYSAGMHIAVSPVAGLSLSETVSMNADVAEYEFPNSHVGDWPPYSRLFSSHFESSYQVGKRLALTASWEASHTDEGYWNGKAFRDPVVSDSTSLSSREEYDIETKTLSNRIRLSAAYSPVGNMEVEFGTEIRDEFPRVYEFRESGGFYLVQGNIDEGDRIFPYISLRDMSDTYPVMIEGRIQSHIYILNRAEAWEARLRRGVDLRYWVVSLSASALF